MSARMTQDKAIRLVAKEVAARALHTMSRDGWESYPELAEHDWNTVADHLLAVVEWPDAEEYARAYRWLAERASGGERDEVPDAAPF